MPKALVLDLETSISKGIHGPLAKDPSNDFYTIIYGTHPDSINVVHRANGFSRNPPTAFMAQLRQCEYLVGLNMGFDLAYIQHLSDYNDFISRGGQLWDCAVAEYLLTGQQHKFPSLAELQLKYLKTKHKEDRISNLFKKGIGADIIIQHKARIPRLWNLYNKYGIDDGRTPLLIFQQQYQKAKKENMLEIIKLYNDYLLALVYLEASGIHINRAECEGFIQEFQNKYVEHLIKAQNILKVKWNDERLPEFNINSPDHKSLILFGGNIEVVVRKSDGTYKNGNPKFKSVKEVVHIDGFGVPSSISEPLVRDGRFKTDDEVINKIYKLENISASVKEYCGHQKEAMAYKKAQKTYAQAFLDDSVNNILYPHYNNTKVATGRLSSSNPNVQNISKKNKFGTMLHNLFIAPPGWKAVACDYNQLEIWASAWLSGDERLKKDLLAGIDLHIVRLQYYNPEYSYDDLFRMSKIELIPEWVKARSNAKTVSYQMAYGAMPKKVAAETGLDLEIVEEIYKKESETYPKSFSLGQKVALCAEQHCQLSRAENIPSSMKKGINGSRIYNDLELLPIFDKLGNVSYNKEMYRRVGIWRSPTNKKYAFLDVGNINNKGSIKRRFEIPQFKNYPMQGSSADIQGATSYECLRYCLQHRDKIKMVNEVHDSKWFYIKEEYLDETLSNIKEIMEDVPTIFKHRFNLDVPFCFPIEIEIGDTFGNMKKYEVIK